MLIAAPRPAGGAALPPALRSTPPGRNRTGGSVSGTRAPGRRRGGGRSLDDRSRGVVELLELERAPQLLERAGLDLANPLAGDAEMLPGLRQRASHAVMEPVADPQDLLLALAQRAQHAVDLLVLELQLDEMLDRRGGLAQVLRAQLLERLDPRPLVERAQAHDQARQPLRAALGDAERARDRCASSISSGCASSRMRPISSRYTLSACRSTSPTATAAGSEASGSGSGSSRPARVAASRNRSNSGSAKSGSTSSDS